MYQFFHCIVNRAQTCLANYTMCSFTPGTQWLVMAAPLKIGLPLCCHFRAKFAFVNFNLLCSNSWKSGFFASIWDFSPCAADKLVSESNFVKVKSCGFWHHGFIPSPFCAWAGPIVNSWNPWSRSQNNCWLVLTLSSWEKCCLQQSGSARCRPSLPCVGGFAYWMAPRNQYWLQFFFRKGYVCADVRWGEKQLWGRSLGSLPIPCWLHTSSPTRCCCLLLCSLLSVAVWETCPLPCF